MTGSKASVAAKVRFEGGAHALRHTSGTCLQDETRDIALVADHLKHVSLNTARSYTRASHVQLKRR